jgi:diaminopimelate epimerase
MVQGVLRFILEKKNLSNKNPISVETSAGIIVLKINRDDSVRVEMGEPKFNSSDIPLNIKKLSTEYLLEEFKLGVLSIGNPHAVLVVDHLESPNIETIASKLQNSDYFPEGVNVGFMQILNRSEIRLRVIERGVGETLSCGSGACAAVIHGVILGLLDSKVDVHLKGGDSIVEYDGNNVYLSGPGEFVYEGLINLRRGPH